MTNWTTLPHETLAAYQVACELLVVVKNAATADLKLRDRALRRLRCGLRSPWRRAGPQSLRAVERAYPQLIENLAGAVTMPKALARACSQTQTQTQTQTGSSRSARSLGF